MNAKTATSKPTNNSKKPAKSANNSKKTSNKPINNGENTAIDPNIYYITFNNTNKTLRINRDIPINSDILLSDLDGELYKTTLNFAEEIPNSSIIQIEYRGNLLSNKMVGGIITEWVRAGILPLTASLYGQHFQIQTLNAKLKTGETIVDGVIKSSGEDFPLNPLYISELIQEDTLRIKLMIISVGSYFIKCESNAAFLEVMHNKDIGIKPDTRILNNLKSLKLRAQFIQSSINLNFLSGTIKFNDEKLIVFHDDRIYLVNKGKKKIISPFDLLLLISSNVDDVEICHNQDGLLANNKPNVVFIRHNNKKVGLYTIDGIKNRLMKALEEGYKDNLEKEVDNYTSLIKEINNTLEDVDELAKPWLNLKASPEVKEIENKATEAIVDELPV